MSSSTAHRTATIEFISGAPVLQFVEFFKSVPPHAGVASRYDEGTLTTILSAHWDVSVEVVDE